MLMCDAVNNVVLFLWMLTPMAFFLIGFYVGGWDERRRK